MGSVQGLGCFHVFSIVAAVESTHQYMITRTCIAFGLLKLGLKQFFVIVRLASLRWSGHRYSVELYCAFVAA